MKHTSVQRLIVIEYFTLNQDLINIFLIRTDIQIKSHANIDVENHTMLRHFNIMNGLAIIMSFINHLWERATTL